MKLNPKQTEALKTLRDQTSFGEVALHHKTLEGLVSRELVAASAKGDKYKITAKGKKLVATL